jgi:hypothetical protein
VIRPCDAFGDRLGIERVETDGARCGAVLFALTLVASIVALVLWTSRELSEPEPIVSPPVQASSASSQ